MKHNRKPLSRFTSSESLQRRRNAASPPRRRGRQLVAGLAAAALGVGLVPLAAPTANAAPVITDPAAFVNPFVGTSNAGNTHPGAVAPFGMLTWGPDNVNTSSGVMRSVTPSGYSYDNNTTRGFSLVHVSGAGCAGLAGDIPFFPYVGTLNAASTSPSTADVSNASTYKATYTHAEEEATPGYYGVTLNNGVQVDLAATTRAGVGTFAYPSGSDATMLIRTSDSLKGSRDASVTIDPANRTVSGWVESGNFCGSFVGDGSLRRSYYKVHFTAEFDTAFTAHGTWKNAAVTPNSTSATGGTSYGTGGYPPAGQGSGAYLTFPAGSEVGVRVGISYVDPEGAEKNLEAEAPEGTTVNQVKTDTKAAWNDELRTIEIGGGTASQQRTFYSALYHSLLHPNIIDDVDGRYPTFEGLQSDGTVSLETLSPSQDHQYTTFSGWDVYRSQVQLVAFLNAKRGSDIVQSLLNQANQYDGVWDRWTHVTGATHVMVGDPSAISVAGMHSFGARDFDVEEAYQSLKKAATVPTEKDLSRQGWNIGVVGQRPSLDQFLQYGYYPQGCNAWGCPNETLEMAMADSGLAVLADALGHDEDAQMFSQRSQSWQNQYNPNATSEYSGGVPGPTGWIHPRNADGAWSSGFNAAQSGSGFVEAPAATYVWLVSHNPAGLFEVMGGHDVADQRLDGFFKDTSGNWSLVNSWNNTMNVNMDNEPSIAAPWLYNYLGKPWKTQDTIRETLIQLWLNHADTAGGSKGIPGNDDLGQMSSWFVFSAMGIYPQNPNRAELSLAAPLFETIKINRTDGPTIEINAPGADVTKRYIDSLEIDGVVSTKNYLPQSVIEKDSVVDFAVSTTANTTRGTSPADAPPSDRTGESLPEVRVNSSKLSTTRGSAAAPVTLTAKNLQWITAAQDVEYELVLPDALTADMTSGTLAVSGSTAVTEEIVIRADWNAEPGTYRAVIQPKSGGVLMRQIPINVEVRAGGAEIGRLVTSFEPGQEQIPSNVRVGPQINVADYCCSIGGFESKVATDGQKKTGSNSVVYSGRATAGNAAATNVLFANLPAFSEPVQANTKLGYSIYPQRTGGPFANYVHDATEYLSLDIEFTDGTFLSQMDAVASNGAALNPVAQGGVLAVDTWNTVEVMMPEAAAGKTVKQVLLRMGSPSNFAPTSDGGYLRGWIDDVSLVEVVPTMVFSNQASIEGKAGQSLGGQLVTFTGGAGTSASDFSATVAWGDGTTSNATITEQGGQFAVTAQHTYSAALVSEAVVTVTDALDTRATAYLPVKVTASDVGPGSGDPVASVMTVSTVKSTFGKKGTVNIAVAATGRVAQGTVTVLSEAGALLGRATLSSGKATVRTPKKLTAGKHKLRVTYSPAAGVAIKPASAEATLQIAKAKPKIKKKVKVIKGKLRVGEKATVRVILKGKAKVRPAGQVRLRVGKTVVGKAKVKKRGNKFVAQIKTKRLKKTGKVNVRYMGNKNYKKAKSATKLRVRR